jgi:hypothetical protein
MLLWYIATIGEGSEGNLVLRLRCLTWWRCVGLLVLFHAVLQHLANEIGLLELELRGKTRHHLVRLLNYLVADEAIECLLLL